MCVLLHPSRLQSDSEATAQEQDGELDAEAFNEKLGPYFGQGLSPAALAQLSMKIDADCGGTVDWYPPPQLSHIS